MSKSFLSTDQFLYSNPTGSSQMLVSNNGYFRALMQQDGDFAIYYQNGPITHRMFSTGSRATGRHTDTGEYFLFMQSDGNLVLYGGHPSRIGKAFWDTGVRGGGQYHVVLQDDGNLCLFRGPDPSNNQGFLWQAGVSFTDRGSHLLVSGVAGDGNMVLSGTKPVTIQTRDSNDAKQRWRLMERNSTDNTQTVLMINEANGQALTANGYGQPVSLTTVPDGMALWMRGGPEYNTSGPTALTAFKPLGNLSLHLNVAGNRYPAGTGVIVWEWKGAQANLVWRTKKVSSLAPVTSDPILDDVYYNIRSGLTGHYLAINGNSFDNGAPLVQASNPSDGNVQFRFPRDGHLYMRSRNSGKYLYFAGFNGEPITQRWDAQRDQLCKFQPALMSNGYYRFDVVNGGNVRLAVSEDGASVGLRPTDPDDASAQFQLNVPKDFTAPEQPGLARPDDDRALQYLKQIAQGVLGAAADKFPGGGAVVSVAFDYAFPDNTLDNMFSQLRADILAEVNVMMQEDKVSDAVKKLDDLRHQFLFDYQEHRRDYFNDNSDKSALRMLSEIHGHMDLSLVVLMPKDIDSESRPISDTITNLNLLKAGLPLYAIGAVEHLLVLQESALMEALEHPNSLAELTILKDRASRHYKRMQKAITYLIAERQSHLSLSDRDDPKNRRWPAVELRDNGIAGGPKLFSYSGGDSYNQWEVASRTMAAYNDHLKFNYERYTYPYWSQAERVKNIADQTDTLCRRLKSDSTFRDLFTRQVPTIRMVRTAKMVPAGR